MYLLSFSHLWNLFLVLCEINSLFACENKYVDVILPCNQVTNLLPQ